MMPLALIESASSCSFTSSICTRGCRSFGARRSISTSITPVRGGSGASGMSALRPLPRAGRRSIMKLLQSCSRLRRPTGEHLLGERHIGGGAARFHVVEHARHAVAWRFAKADVARNDRVEHLVLEELAHIARNELTEIRAVVVHGQQHALDIE